jgi:hypothetical protein
VAQRTTSAAANTQKDAGMPGFLEPIWETIFRIATWSALIFGALSIGSAFVSAWVGWEITDATQKDADVRIRAGDVRMAEANARTKEAELKLEQLRKDWGPRQLQRDIFIKEVTGQPTAHVEIMYLQDDPECFELAQQIWRALEDGKWPVEAPKPIPSLILSDGPTPMSVGGQPSGVTVVVRGITQEETEAAENAMMGRAWVKTPWSVLTHALGLSLGKISSHAGGASTPPEGVLRVVVSPRL